MPDPAAAPRQRTFGRGLSRLLYLSAIIIACIALPHLARAEAVVVASTAPDLGLGYVLPEGRVVELPAGAEVSLLTRDGQVIVLNGPFTGSYENAGSDFARHDLSLLLRTGAVDMSGLGGHRAIASDTCPGPARVSIDATDDATYCLAPPYNVRLARARDDLRLTILLSHEDSRATEEAAFAIGERQAPWPRALPLSDGTVYRADWIGRSRPLRFQFRLLDEPMACGAAELAALAHLGCVQQVNQRLGAVRDSIAPFGLHLTTGRGTEAQFRFGEPLGLRAQANRDAWLYCFHRQENGTVTPIFPGKRMLGARIPASQPVDIAGSRQGRLLVVGPPAGREVIACFATSRDVTGRLPADWLNDRLAPLPGLQLGEVQRAFAELTDVETAAGQVAIQVVDR